MGFPTEDVVKRDAFTGVCLVESLHTGDFSAPGRSRTAAPLEIEVVALVQAAERDLLELLVVDHHIRDLFPNGWRPFYPGSPLPALLLLLTIKESASHENQDQDSEHKYCDSPSHCSSSKICLL
jgi:hypothetical protein